MISYSFVKKPRVLVKNERVKVQKKTITTSLKQKHKAALQIKKNINHHREDTHILIKTPAVSTQNRHTAPECTPHNRQKPQKRKLLTAAKNTPSALNSTLLLV